MPSEKQTEAATTAIIDKIQKDGFVGYREAVSIILTAAEQAEPYSKPGPNYNPDSQVIDKPAPAADMPLGAVENGRVFLQRLVDHYEFQCEAGSLDCCSDYHGAVRCFEAMAEWIHHGQIADRDFWKEQFQIETRVRIEFQDALSNIANAYTAHGYSDAIDAVQNLKDIAKEALDARL